MSNKAKTILMITISVIGLLIAGLGLGMSTRDAAGASTITWIGIAITLVTSFISILTAQKSDKK